MSIAAAVPGNRMGCVSGKRNQDEEDDRGIGGVKLRGEENDRRLQKIKTGRDRGAPSLKNRVGNVAGDERTGRGHEGNEKADNLKLS